MKTKTFFDLLVFKTGANLRTEVSRYYLNYLWWVFNPLSSMLVFYVVFGIMLDRGTEHFVAFLLCGLTSWQWFANTVNNASASIYQGRGLMLQVNIPKIFFPLEVLLRDSFKQLFVLGLLLFFLFFYPTPVSSTWIALPILLLVQFIINAGLALLCAALVPFVPDLKFVIGTLIQLAFFGSGIFFSVEQVVLPEHRFIVYLNPMAGLIKNYREILIYSHWPDWTYLMWVTIGGLALLSGAVYMTFRLDHYYPRICQQ